MKRNSVFFKLHTFNSFFVLNGMSQSSQVVRILRFTFQHSSSGLFEMFSGSISAVLAMGTSVASACSFAFSVSYISWNLQKRIKVCVCVMENSLKTMHTLQSLFGTHFYRFEHLPNIRLALRSSIPVPWYIKHWLFLVEFHRPFGKPNRIDWVSGNIVRKQYHSDWISADAIPWKSFELFHEHQCESILFLCVFEHCSVAWFRNYKYSNWENPFCFLSN